MAKKFILILGGVRSGKSKFAQSLAKRLGEKVLFVATGEPLDEEMALRIEEHKRTRPENWRTLEINIKVGQQLEGQIGDADVVLLDCLTLLVSNILTREGTESSRHCEPFASCHSEQGEESHGAQDRLLEAISLLSSDCGACSEHKRGIPLLVCFGTNVPRNDIWGKIG